MSQASGPMTRTRTILLAVAAMTAALVAAPVSSIAALSSAPPAVAAINNQDRAAVVAAYRDVMVPALDVPIGWNGNVATCDPGQPSAAAQNATLTAVNYVRSMSGQDAVTFDPALSAKAQKAALIMHARGEITHTPPSHWPCWSQDGYDGASSSNVCGGCAGAEAVAAYMEDFGASNTSVGHRRWVTDWRREVMGSGSTSEYNALYVFGPTDLANTKPARMSWPTAGYFPDPMEPRGRWSFSVTDGTSLTGASVSVRDEAGAEMVTQVHPLANGYGSPTLVWEVGELTPAAAGNDQTYHVSIRLAGQTEPAYEYSTTMVAVPLAVTTAPAMSGSAVVGSTLSVTDGTWSPSPRAFDYTWLREGEPIGFADEAQYTLVAADVGARISVRVTALHDHMTTTRYVTPQTQPVEKRPFTLLTAPSVPTTARVGLPVDADPGEWRPAPNSFTYQWLADGTPITGADSRRYVPTNGDHGSVLSVEVTARCPSCVPRTETSNLSDPVEWQQFTLSGQPSIDGTAKVGQRLSLDLPSWSPAPTFTFQWRRDGQAIPNTNERGYLLTPDDLGAVITVAVTGERPSFATKTVVTAPTNPVALGGPLALKTRPAISGTTTVGKTLRVSKGIWSPTAASWTYQWFRGTTRITGATGQTYRLVRADRGKRITAQVTARRPGYAPGSAKAAPTAPIG